MNPYVRRLSAIERVWLVADRITPPFVNQLVLEGQGALDPDPWQAAVARAAESNPGVRVVLEGALKRSRWVDSGNPPPVRSVDGSAWDGRGPDGAPFLVEPLPVRTGPTVEVLLVTGTPSRVVFRTHHAVTDGRGTLSFVEDVFRALRDEPPIGSDSALDDVSLSRELQAGEAERREEDCLAPTGRAEGQEPGVRWRRVTVAGRPSRLLPRVALAVARAARAGGEDGRVRLDIPVDMRPRRSGLRSTANLTGILHLDVPREADEETLFHALRAQLDASAEARLDKGLDALRWLPLGFMSWAGGVAVRRMQRRGRYGSSGVLSNLGRLPLAGYQGGGFAARTGFFIPPGADTQPFFLALCGNDEGVELVASMPRVLAGDGRLERLLDDLL